ncbi:MAG: hypothetical protein ACI835_003094 [Planctomycetota bacterium]|jgi:hypothetical protein
MRSHLFGCLAALLLILSAQAQTNGNYLLNPGFEFGSAPWTGGTIHSTDSYTGTACLELGAHASAFQALTNPVVLSDIAEASAWVKGDVQLSLYLQDGTQYDAFSQDTGDWKALDMTNIKDST